MDIHERIKRLREARGWTQQRLAEKAQLSITAVQKVEQGRHIPRLDTLMKIAEAFGTSVSELLKEAARRLPAAA